MTRSYYNQKIEPIGRTVEDIHAKLQKELVIAKKAAGNKGDEYLDGIVFQLEQVVKPLESIKSRFSYMRSFTTLK